MNDDVNLIIQKQQRKFELSKLLLIVFILFGLVFLIAFSITLYTLFLKSRAAALSTDVSSAKARIANYSITKQKILTVSERLSTTKNIIAKRKDLSTMTGTVIGSIPDTFNINSIKAEGNVIIVELESSSLALYDDFLETKLPAFVKDANVKVKKIESSSFTRSGGYVLNLEYYF